MLHLTLSFLHDGTTHIGHSTVMEIVARWYNPIEPPNLNLDIRTDFRLSAPTVIYSHLTDRGPLCNKEERFTPFRNKLILFKQGWHIGKGFFGEMPIGEKRVFSILNGNMHINPDNIMPHNSRKWSNMTPLMVTFTHWWPINTNLWFLPLVSHSALINDHQYALDFCKIGTHIGFILMSCKKTHDKMWIACCENPSVKIFVAIIPKEGLPCGGPPILLLIWHLLYNIICEGCRSQFYSQCHTKGRIRGAPPTNPSFGMTMANT